MIGDRPDFFGEERDEGAICIRSEGENEEE